MQNRARGITPKRGVQPSLAFIALGKLLECAESFHPRSRVVCHWHLRWRDHLLVETMPDTASWEASGLMAAFLPLWRWSFRCSALIGGDLYSERSAAPGFITWSRKLLLRGRVVLHQSCRSRSWRACAFTVSYCVGYSICQSKTMASIFPLSQGDYALCNLKARGITPKRGVQPSLLVVLA